MTQKPRKACADPVAITGIGGRYPSSMNPDEFWINLCTSFEMCDQSNYRWPKGKKIKSKILILSLITYLIIPLISLFLFHHHVIRIHESATKNGKNWWN